MNYNANNYQYQYVMQLFVSQLEYRVQNQTELEKLFWRLKEKNSCTEKKHSKKYFIVHAL